MMARDKVGSSGRVGQAMDECSWVDARFAPLEMFDSSEDRAAAVRTRSGGALIMLQPFAVAVCGGSESEP